MTVNQRLIKIINILLEGSDILLGPINLFDMIIDYIEIRNKSIILTIAITDDLSETTLIEINVRKLNKEAQYELINVLEEMI